MQCIKLTPAMSCGTGHSKILICPDVVLGHTRMILVIVVRCEDACRIIDDGDDFSFICGAGVDVVV